MNDLILWLVLILTIVAIPAVVKGIGYATVSLRVRSEIMVSFRVAVYCRRLESQMSGSSTQIF